MKFAIFTQDERVYLPIPIGIVADARPEDIACIVLCPPMSTHGGKWKGLRKHLAVFRLQGAFIMAWRIFAAKIFPLLGIRPSDRKYWTIAEIGKAHNVPTYHVPLLKSSQLQDILEKHPADLLISVSCPQIIRPDVLNHFKHGGVNVHSGDLPKYRGLMPTFWTLYHEEKQTGVTVHYLGDKLDNGEILLQKKLEVTDDDTWDSLILKTKTEAGSLLLEVIDQCAEGRIDPQPNPDDESTYFSFPTAEDARTFRARGKKMF